MSLITDTLPAGFEINPSDFDRGHVVIAHNFNGEPFATVLWNGAPVLTLDMEVYEDQKRIVTFTESPWTLLTPALGEEANGYRAQTLAAFLQHIGAVADPEGDDAFGNSVAEVGFFEASDRHEDLFDDGHAICIFVDALAELVTELTAE